MRFYCSKKLLDLLEESHSLNNTMLLPIHPIEDTENQNELYDWHASVAELDGAYVATFTNDLTNFPVVVGLVDVDHLYDILGYLRLFYLKLWIVKR